MVWGMGDSVIEMRKGLVILVVKVCVMLGLITLGISRVKYINSKCLESYH